MCCAPRLPLLPDRCLPAWAISTAYVFGVGSDLELAALASSPTCHTECCSQASSLGSSWVTHVHSHSFPYGGGSGLRAEVMS